MPIQRKLKFLALSAAFGLMSLPSAQAATVTWDFTYAAVSSLPNGPFTSVASLKLEDSKCNLLDCVLFTLDPNESNAGYKASDANGTPSTIDRLNIAFKTNVSEDTAGADLPNTPKVLQSHHQLTSISGEPIDWSFWSMIPGASDDHIDAGYSTGEGQFAIEWRNNDFGVSQISMWSILRTTIADNFSVMATPTGVGSSKPSPTFGILSISAFNGADGSATSNWATGPSPVPVPASVWLFGTALLGFIGFSSRSKV